MATWSERHPSLAMVAVGLTALLLALGRRTGGRAATIRERLAATGGFIIAAAASMVMVFGLFVLLPSRVLQQFALGLAAVILIDAVVIRCLGAPLCCTCRSCWDIRRRGRHVGSSGRHHDGP
ncbi:hypothetical protein [Nocardioides sp. SYSU DS0651]|uniref:hypothetical protein n=1 Tax=Nocardioides sp. SYSU DS0651 TaxID=3415955 RepID=UPI003F4BA600